jgi:Pentapeptide repeats (8 copies)
VANPEHLVILKQGVEIWNHWRESNPVIKPNLRGAKLKGKALEGFDFSGANIRSTDFTNAQLQEANFTGATLTGAYIEDWGITADTIFNGVICDYVFMRLPPEKRPDWLKLPPEESLDENPRRKPDDWNKNFEEGEFEDFIVPLIQTLDLYHNQAFDPRLVAISFKDLQQAHPEAELELISMEKKGKNRDKLYLKVATSPQADLSTLHADSQ